MTDAPERTLSERIREGHYFQTPTGTRYRLADEVAALEQELDELQAALMMASRDINKLDTPRFYPTWPQGENNEN